MKQFFARTIEQKMRDTGKHSSGFDYIRLIFAILIIARHTLVICQGVEAENPTWVGPFRPYYEFLVPVFFALSGFLVAGSLARTNNLPTFLTLRVLRIFPALGGEVLISALLIGPYVTELPLREYFTHPQFFRYFLNMIGDIHYYLPGAFVYNQVSWVNIQLWTVPYDLECYAIITVLAFLGIVRSPVWFGFAALIFSVYGFGHDWFSGMLGMYQRNTGHMVTSTFLWGVFLYLWRHRIPYHPALFCLAAVITWFCLKDPGTAYIGALPLAYVTIYVGLMNPPKIFLIDSRDYSYALYLYGVPVQQLVYYMLPKARVWYVHFPVSLMISGFLAYLSWTFLESKIMNLKKPAIARVNAFCETMQRKMAR
jgi:peptidoglycan/LPS O-acetylase OafA/YrhL